ncbi:hypothetical protein [Sulfurovum sp.]|uniref:hypothetical protein n=1 Tax=Sulfurovum sp. TaxID=1969726 RepID=UPI0025E5BD73|nr:hypothetical protein [Sulfurovum sp.]
MKLFILLLMSLFFFTACSSGIGMGVGVSGAAASENGIAASEIYTDSENGFHGSIAMGTDINL